MDQQKWSSRMAALVLHLAVLEFYSGDISRTLSAADETVPPEMLTCVRSEAGYSFDM
jgi:hypothetical protein